MLAKFGRYQRNFFMQRRPAAVSVILTHIAAISWRRVSPCVPMQSKRQTRIADDATDDE
jgi:hypothetical protein